MDDPKEVNNMALETLLSAARDVAPEIPEDLLRRVFALQKTHQFDAERGVSLQELQRLLDDFVGNPSDVDRTQK